MFLPSLAFGQGQQFDANQGNQNNLPEVNIGQPIVEARPYGLELKTFVKGLYNNQAGYPTATTSETIITVGLPAGGWGGEVARCLWIILTLFIKKVL